MQANNLPRVHCGALFGIVGAGVLEWQFWGGSTCLRVPIIFSGYFVYLAGWKSLKRGKREECLTAKARIFC